MNLPIKNAGSSLGRVGRHSKIFKYTGSIAKLPFCVLICLIGVMYGQSPAWADVCEEKLYDKMNVEEEYLKNADVESYLKEWLDIQYRGQYRGQYAGGHAGKWFKGKVKSMSLEQYNALSGRDYPSQLVPLLPVTAVFKSEADFSETGEMLRAAIIGKETTTTFEKDRKFTSDRNGKILSEERIMRNDVGHPVKRDFFREGTLVGVSNYTYDKENNS